MYISIVSTMYMYEEKKFGREIFLTEEMFSSLIYLGWGQFIRNSQNFGKK